MKEKIALRSKAKNIEPAVRIGKNGLTEGLIEEIKRQLEKNGIIKVKVLKGIFQDIGKKKFAEELAAKTGSELIELVGFVVVLHKKEKYI